MKVTLVVLLIVHGVLPKWIYAYPHHNQQYCSEENIKRIRTKYLREIISEVDDDLEDLYDIQSGAVRTVQFKVNKLLRETATAAQNAKQNGQNIEECLNTCKARINSLKESFDEQLTTKCDFKAQPEFQRITAAIERATAQIEKCATLQWSTCKTIERCCDKVEFGDYLENYIENLIRKYRRCVSSALSIVDSGSSGIRQEIKDCSLLTTQTERVDSTTEVTTNNPTSEGPAAVEGSTEEPSTEQPSTEESSTEEPSTEEPSTEEPSTEEPSTEEPSTEQSSTDEPSTEEQSTEEPSTEEPTTEEPSTEEPSTENPSTEEPSTEEASTEEPTTEEPSTEEPTTEGPSTVEPSTEELGSTTKDGEQITIPQVPQE